MLNVVWSKVVSILALSVGTFLCGALPRYLGTGRKCSRSIYLSAVLCFGAGVLLATSIVHILPDSQRLLPPKWAEIFFCTGYLVIYLVDEFVQFLCKCGNRDHTEQPEAENLLEGNNPDYGSRNRLQKSCDAAQHSKTACRVAGECEDSAEQSLPDANMLTATNWTAQIGLILAFSVHSLLEGLVIGIQRTNIKVFLLLGAVASHKLVVAFCVGAELVTESRSSLSYFVSLAVFSLGSPAGIALGLGIDQIPQNNYLVPVLQAVAGGTLLYVMLSEVLPRERARWQHHMCSAGLCQFAAVTVGAILITAINLLIQEP